MVQQTKRPKILVICDYYLPGYESGGSMRTLVNMVDRLSDRLEFHILTRDHDGKLNRNTYKSVAINEWNSVGNARVYYLSKDKIRPRSVREIVDAVNPDAIYVNSLFSPLTIYTLALRKLGKIPGTPIIVAPEGELSDGSLSIKPLKKKLFLFTAKLFNLHSDIVWKAAAEAERIEIVRIIGTSADLLTAANMPPKMILENYDQTEKLDKTKGSVRLVFLSRYMITKNLNWLLRHLTGIKGKLEIDIYGPIENKDYWDEAAEIIESLPENITVSALGPVPNIKAAETMAKYHFFVLPTLGENFGHVMIEALAAGCPLIISDRTPWQDLETKGIGWDLSLDSPSKWIETLEKCIDMPFDEYLQISGRARSFAVQWLENPSLDKSNMQVFEKALSVTAVK